MEQSEGENPGLRLPDLCFIFPVTLDAQRPMIPLTLSFPREKLDLPHRKAVEKKGCFLILYHYLEGLPTQLGSPVSLRESDGDGRGSNTWALLVHKSFCECKRFSS